MKIKYIFLFSLVAAISSCTTAYRSGQTPDDVYYSPAPEQNSYVNSVNDRDRNSYYYRNDDSYRNDEESEIRRGIRNPIYRNSIALDLGFGYNPYNYSPFGYSPYMYSPYGYGSSYGYNPYMSHGMYNPYLYNYNSFGYSSFYNPYNRYYPGVYGSPYYGHGYYPGFITSGRVNTNTGARRYNLNAYNNSVDNSPAAIRNAVRSNISEGSSAPVRSFNTRPRGTNNSGNVIRRVSPSENRRSNSRSTNRTYDNNRNNRNDNNTRQERPTYQAPTRSFESSAPSSSNNSSSGSSNSSAPVRSFRR